MTLPFDDSRVSIQTVRREIERKLSELSTVIDALPFIAPKHPLRTIITEGRAWKSLHDLYRLQRCVHDVLSTVETELNYARLETRLIALYTTVETFISTLLETDGG